MFAIDLGNRQIKTSDGEMTDIIPTSLVREKDYSGYGESKLEDFELYTIDNESCYIGKDVKKFINARSGLQTSTDRYVDNQIFKFLAIAAIARYAKNHLSSKKGNLKITLMAGLPSEDFQNNKNIENVRKIFSGKHEVIYNNNGEERVVNFTVDEVYFVPQPYGSFLSTALKGIDIVEGIGDQEDFDRYDEYNKSRLAIIDVGGGDLQFVIVEYGQFVTDKAIQLRMGAIELFNDIRSRLMKEYNIKGNHNEIESLVREGIENNTYRFVYKVNRRKEIDITDIVVESIEDWTRRIVEEFQLAYRDSETLDFVMIAGGGANIVDKEIIDNAFNKEYERTVFVSNSEMANVDGYIKRLQILENGGD
ncbi:hypothetical protein FC36_GL000293 [Ligilactobacillus equi DSM 15833 = JCM 10991]|uniref:Actin-like protein N-terminal domain-containing protein n=1 Tax=Ligilactobacillus equi DSM 15833 = JCM 10991 TaxID=1423740 RepID=A0A0R1U0G3_9LACO|nr:hypothetical protein FC36_GL000293 [Ligilactobacillus equi DSM 15833 = JCM 10991]